MTFKTYLINKALIVYIQIKKLDLIENNGWYEASVNLKDEIAMLQVEGDTVINILISVDGEDWVTHTSDIVVNGIEIINLVNAKFMMYLKIQSQNNVEINLLN